MDRHSQLLRNQAFIGGQWVPASDEKRFDVTDPANGKVLASIADCTPQDAEAAILAAQTAFAGWKKRPGKERARLLRRWFDLITSHAESSPGSLPASRENPFRRPNPRSPTRHLLSSGFPRKPAAFTATSSRRRSRAANSLY
jgi:Aldehyde dehydrogenase family